MRDILKTNTIILGLVVTLTTILSCSKDDEGSKIPDNAIVIPDANFEQKLIDLGVDSNGINGYVLKSDAESVTELNLENADISSIEGIEGFINLEHLRIGGNFIEQVDISHNTELKLFASFDNEFTSLDVRANLSLTALAVTQNANLIVLRLGNHSALEVINVTGSGLIELDLSQYVNLRSVNAGNTSLQYLNVNNSNNENIEMFNILYNPDLYCVEVDNVSYSTATWTAKDAHTEYVLDCQ